MEQNNIFLAAGTPEEGVDCGREGGPSFLREKKENYMSLAIEGNVERGTRSITGALPLGKLRGENSIGRKKMRTLALHRNSLKKGEPPDLISRAVSHIKKAAGERPGFEKSPKRPHSRGEWTPGRAILSPPCDNAGREFHIIPLIVKEASGKGERGECGDGDRGACWLVLLCARMVTVPCTQGGGRGGRSQKKQNVCLLDLERLRRFGGRHNGVCQIRQDGEEGNAIQECFRRREEGGGEKKVSHSRCISVLRLCFRPGVSVSGSTESAVVLKGVCSGSSNIDDNVKCAGEGSSFFVFEEKECEKIRGKTILF